MFIPAVLYISVVMNKSNQSYLTLGCILDYWELPKSTRNVSNLKDTIKSFIDIGAVSLIKGNYDNVNSLFAVEVDIGSFFPLFAHELVDVGINYPEYWVVKFVSTCIDADENLFERAFITKKMFKERGGVSKLKDCPLLETGEVLKNGKTKKYFKING
jgi:hypothetical protein